MVEESQQPALPRDPSVASVPTEAPASDVYTNSPAALDYGRDQLTRPSGRKLVRYAVIAVALLTFTVGSWIVGRTARSGAQAALYVNQARSHVESADVVVYEDDPAIANALLQSDDYRPLGDALPGHVSSGGQVMAALEDPEAFQVLRDVLDDETVEQLDRTIDRYGALVFLHELTTANGLRRIVAVRFLPNAINGQAMADAGLIAQVFNADGWAKPEFLGSSRAPLLLPSEPEEMTKVRRELFARRCETQPGLTTDVLRQTFMPLGDRPTMRWFAGQPDALNGAHFTIDFEVDGTRRTVDGYLTDDGGNVEMFVRPDYIENASDFLDVRGVG
ncbi:MAG: hypothetical protein AAGK78_00300 [Planctomycetota bacterium]